MAAVGNSQRTRQGMRPACNWVEAEFRRSRFLITCWFYSVHVVPLIGVVPSFQLMIFGFFLCVDAFLYVFTLLPLRVLLALLRLLALPCCGFR